MTGINRRRALGVGAAGVAALNTRPLWAQAAPAKLKAVVTLAGRTYEFNEESGQDLGDYTPASQTFIQRCIRAEVANFPLTVFFRPDRNSDRVEVVFELGRVFSQNPANFGAYSVVISRGTQILARMDVPEHYWFARWRWQSSPRPVVADLKKAMQYGLLPPYDLPTSASTQSQSQALRLMPLPSGDYVDLDVVGEFTSGNYKNASKLLMKSAEYQARTTGAGNAVAQLAAGASSYSVMRLAGVQAYMPNTGERPDIGPVTEPQAKYLQTYDQGALALMMSQAEAAGTMPWHIRDERQAAPFDFRQYPNATWYASGNAGAPQIKLTESPITIDSAHQPALTYVPFLLTEDPYFLEEMQFQATWNWGSLPAAYRPTAIQPRMFAWNLRTLAQAARSTQTVTPSWLLNSHYWTAQLEQTRVWFEQNYVYSNRPERQRFHVVGDIDAGRGEAGAPEGTWVDPWQDEFAAMIMGWVVYMGFGNWRTSFQWLIRSTIDRASGNRGWIRAFATPYRMILRASKTAPVAQSWAEAWQLTKSIAQKNVVDPDAWAEDDMTYLTYTRGALVYAKNLGISEAAEPLAWATNQLKKRAWNVAAKWRFGGGL